MSNLSEKGIFIPAFSFKFKLKDVVKVVQEDVVKVVQEDVVKVVQEDVVKVVQEDKVVVQEDVVKVVQEDKVVVQEDKSATDTRRAQCLSEFWSFAFAGAAQKAKLIQKAKEAKLSQKAKLIQEDKVVVPKKEVTAISIPAGDWTVEIGGNVNANVNYTKYSGAHIANGINGTLESFNNVGTGRLPHFLGVSGKTRQNDLDLEFTVGLTQRITDRTTEFRQAYLTFGDKSWGTVKLGRDIGIFASDAILNDMTLLGVRAGLLAGGTSTGYIFRDRIGSGYLYADWKSQLAYTTPNFNGLQATVGVTNPTHPSSTTGDKYAYEGNASYSFGANDFTGKLWTGATNQKLTYTSSTPTIYTYTAKAAEIGATVSVGDFGLTGYYYRGNGVGTPTNTTNNFNGLYLVPGGKTRDSDGGYAQATYVLPIGTKLGLSYGISRLDLATDEVASNSVKNNERYTVGAYHPLTKQLNLVAEYNNVESIAHDGTKGEAKTGSLGAILTF